MKAARYIKSGMIAYQGIAQQVQAEREATDTFYAGRIASTAANGHRVDTFKRGTVQVRYVMRFSTRYARMWGYYEV